MVSILLHSKSGLVGRSDDVSIHFTREPRSMIDIPSLDSRGGFREFVAGFNPGRTTIVAKDITFADSFIGGGGATDDVLNCDIIEGGRLIARANVIIEELRNDSHPISLRGVITARFIITGAIEYFGMTGSVGPIGMQGVQDNRGIIDVPLILPEGEQIVPTTRGIKILKSRLHKEDNTGHTNIDWVTIDDPMPIPIKLIKGGFKIIP